MFSRKNQRREGTSSSTRSLTFAPPLVSPLQERFSYTDQGLPSPVSATHIPSDFRSPDHGSDRESSSTISGRPFSSNGSEVARPRSIVDLKAPQLPPIPRVTSQYERAGQTVNRKKSQFDFEWESDREAGPGAVSERAAKDDGSNGPRQSGIKPDANYQQAERMHPLRPIVSTAFSESSFEPQSAISSARESPRMDLQMQSSLFPGPPGPQAPSTGILASAPGPALSRFEVDARDRVYNQAPQRPPMASSRSSPAIPLSPSLHQGTGNTRSPLSPPPVISAGSKQSLQTTQASSRKLVKGQKVMRSSHSGSPARESIRSPDSATFTQSTVGTPFEETSPSFPLPQHVATRPKTIGSTSSIAGVEVPTHHSQGKPPEMTSAKSGEKRKTRLLNPVALLTRRRSAQEDNPTSAERAAQNTALAKQKSIAAAGVDKMPADYDPRIRGKTVHDFSAPRPIRNYSYNDAESLSPQQRQLQAAFSAPAMPVVQEPYDGAEHAPRQASSHSQQRITDSSSRHRFIEHFDEDSDSQKRTSSIQAENLENKEFLQRASHQSSASNYSQDGAVLPPFARKNHIMDPMQASFFHDGASKRSSYPSSGKDRYSSISNLHETSPVLSRSSGQLGTSPVMDGSSQQHAYGVGSPMSPESAGFPNFVRPMSSGDQTDTPRVRGWARSESETMPLGVPLAEMPAGDKGSATQIAQPAAEMIAESDLPERPSSPRRVNHSEPFDTYQMGQSRSPSVVPTPPPAPASPNTASDVMSSARGLASPPRLVERRASAVGHSKRSSSGPKHRASNASRFSFQMGTGSAAEERALEEKHRLAEARGDIPEPTRNQRGASPDDDDDYFDEDAMDDMDEMEMQDQSPMEDFQRQSRQFLQPQSRANINHLRPPTAGSLMRQDSDQGSVYDDDDEPEMRGGGQASYTNISAVQSSRDASDRPNEYLSRSLSVDQYLAGENTSIQTAAENDSAQRSGFYMQPGATSGAYNLPESPRRSTSGPQSATREGHVQKHPDAFGPQNKAGANNRPEAAANVWTGGWNDFHFNDGPDLSLESSCPTSFQAPPLSPSMDQFVAHGRGRSGDWKELTNRTSHLSLSFSPVPAQANNVRKDSNTPSAPYNGAVGRGISVRDPRNMNQNFQYAKSETDDSYDDEMYFDDGGFDGDFAGGYDGHSVDEDAFDDPLFLARTNGASSNMDHRRNTSAMTYNSLGSDGPYPSFAMPNPAAARQRESTMLLQDLPLQAQNGPRHVPRRIPSVEAKRLGLSNKVPPLPRTGSSDGFLEEKANLQAYHAALAEATNRAEAEGRFFRMPSVSTERSESSYSNRPAEEVRPTSANDRSRYSRMSHDRDFVWENSNANDHNARQSTLGANLGPGRSDSKSTSTHSHVNDNLDYSPPKMSFDFGFDRLDFGSGDQSSLSQHNDATTQPVNPANNTDSNPYPYDINNDFNYDDYEAGSDDDLNNDDIIAAANSEALAHDSEGYYGQEFGFYAKARPDSGELAEAEIGGFFGEMGDDGLMRQKSLREPNLTPITERSEFSTRNSFIALSGMPSAGLHGPMSPAVGRLPLSPLVPQSSQPDAVWGTSNNSGDGSYFPRKQPPAPAGAQGYFGPSVFAADAAGKAALSPRHESPQAAVASPPRGYPGHSLPWTDSDVTPRKGVFSSGAGGETQTQTPPTARKAPVSGPAYGQAAASAPGSGGGSGNGTGAPTSVPNSSHSRNGSGADSVTYVREKDPAGSGQPRWVLERRRTSELGLQEVVGREVVQGGWI